MQKKKGATEAVKKGKKRGVETPKRDRGYKTIPDPSEREGGKDGEDKGKGNVHNRQGGKKGKAQTAVAAELTPVRKQRAEPGGVDEGVGTPERGPEREICMAKRS